MRDAGAVAKPPDGRRARSTRTKEAIVQAYLGLLREKRDIPTSAQVAKRAGLSARAVFGHFTDRETLAVVVFDHVLAHRRSTDVSDKVGADRITRIRFQVEVRARNCEFWLPLWRVVMLGQPRSQEIRDRIERLRDLALARLNLMYRPELVTLSDADRIVTLSALEALTAFESWGRMREHYKLSYAEACAAWIKTIDRLLPPTP